MPAALLFVPLLGGATVLADWDLPELLARADRVVIGRIGARRVVRVDDAAMTRTGMSGPPGTGTPMTGTPMTGTPMTETRVEVAETLFGTPVRTLIVSQIRGELGGKKVWVDGDAELVPKITMVLFTYQHRDGRTYLVGMALGAFFVEQDRLSQHIDGVERTRSLAQLRALIAARGGPRR